MKGDSYGKEKKQRAEAELDEAMPRQPVDGIDDPVEYFLGQDNSGHWYLVLASRRQEWYSWTELDDEDEAAWEAPDFAERLDGSPGRVIFSNYRFME